jgi:hypothetical protein
VLPLLALIAAGVMLPTGALAQPLATYQSPNNGFSFQYPTGWRSVSPELEVSIGNTVERVAFATPDDAAILIVTVTQLTGRVSDADIPGLKPEFDAVMQRVADLAEGTVLESELIDGSDVGRRHLFVVVFEYEDLGDVIQSRQYSFFEADRQYTIVLEAEAPDQEVYAGALDGVLSSFRVDAR